MDIGHNMNISLKWMALAGLVCLAGNVASGAEFVDRSANNAPEGHRFLFVVETSSGNRKFESGNRQALFDLIVNGINGQMRTGDTYGIWTFSEEVHSGEFPLTVFEKDQALELAGQAAAFLQKQRYVKRTSLQFLVNDLRHLSDRVGDFNVFIISSGEDPIGGTPFDQNINAAYKALSKQSAKTGRPMVTTFVVRKGRPVRSGVVLAGDRIVLPERPPESMAATPKRPPAGIKTNSTDAALVSANSNLISTASTTESPAAAPPPRKKVMQIITKTNTAMAATSPTNSAAATNAGPLAAIVSAEPSTNSPTEVAPTPVATTTPPPIATATPPPTSIAPAPAPLSLAPTLALTPAPAPSAAPTATPGPATATPPAPAPTPAPPDVTQTDAKEPSPEAAASPSTPASTTIAPISNLPQAALVSTPLVNANGPQATATTLLVVQAREPSVYSNVIARSAPPAFNADLPVMQGIIVRTDGLSAGVLLAIGGTLMGAACFLLFLLLRRDSSGARGSVITQAMRPER